MPSVVESLIVAGRLTRISRDRQLINQLLEQAQLHIQSAALLVYHGLRATSRGGHYALFECISELSDELRKYVADLELLRRQRNTYEYPSAAGKGPSASQIQHALATAQEVQRIVIELVRE